MHHRAGHEVKHVIRYKAVGPGVRAPLVIGCSIICTPADIAVEVKRALYRVVCGGRVDVGPCAAGGQNLNSACNLRRSSRKTKGLYDLVMEVAALSVAAHTLYITREGSTKSRQYSMPRMTLQQ